MVRGGLNRGFRLGFLFVAVAFIATTFLLGQARRVHAAGGVFTIAVNGEFTIILI